MSINDFKRKIEQFLFILGAIPVLYYGISWRIEMLVKRAGFSGGDAYDFLRASQALTQFSYPIYERRLPFFPIVLLPVSHIPYFALDYSKMVSLICGIATLFLITFLAYRLTRSFVASLTALFFTASSTVLILASVRALADSLFVMLVVMCLLMGYYVFFISRKSKGTLFLYALFGLLLGATSLTRYEGFLVSGILLGVFFFFSKHKKQIIVAGLAFFFTISPLILKNVFIHKNLFYTSYLTEPGYGADNSNILKERMETAIVQLPSVLFSWSPLVVEDTKIIWNRADIKKIEKISLIKERYLPDLFAVFSSKLILLLYAIGSFILIKKYRGYGLAFVLSTIGLYALANWWEPRARFYASQIPLFATLAAVGFAAVLNMLHIRWKLFLMLLALPVFFFLFSNLKKAAQVRIASEQHDIQDTAVLVRSLKQLSQLHKKTYTNAPGIEIINFYSPGSTFIQKVEEIDMHKCRDTECVWFTTMKEKQGVFKTEKYEFTPVYRYIQPLSKNNIYIFIINSSRITQNNVL